MRIWRFVVGPELIEVPYGLGFANRLESKLTEFADKYGFYPNVCYVSLRCENEWNLDGVVLKYQTLLNDNEVLIGCEEIGELKDDIRIDERSIG